MSHDYIYEACDECPKRGCLHCQKLGNCSFAGERGDGSECHGFDCTTDAMQCYTENAIAAAEAREDR